jgi:hypothetical protein
MARPAVCAAPVAEAQLPQRPISIALRSAEIIRRKFSQQQWEAEMICRHLVPVISLVAFALSPLAAQSDEYPVLHVAPLCRGITQQSSLQEGFQTVTFDECMKAEQADRETMMKEWSTFSVADKTHCIAEAEMGGESSYTDLVTCLEMARDVGNLNDSTQSGGSVEGPSQKQIKNLRRRRQKRHVSSIR